MDASDAGGEEDHHAEYPYQQARDEEDSDDAGTAEDVLLGAHAVPFVLVGEADAEEVGRRGQEARVVPSKVGRLSRRAGAPTEVTLLVATAAPESRSVTDVPVSVVWYAAP